MGTLLPARGAPVYLAPADGVAFTLAELQAVVGGFIEVVRSHLMLSDRTPLYLVLNEDGKRLQLPVNGFGTALLRAAGGMPDDVVVGDVLVATAVEMGEGDEEES